MTRRILIVTGTRADLGSWRPVVEEIARHPSEVRARLLVTAMHLDPRFGLTVREVRGLPAEIAAEVPCTPSGDGRAEMGAAIGVALQGMARVIDAEQPDWLLVLGDRGEQLAAALAALHLQVPVAHLHGGETTLGAVDDTVRDMITRIAHIHLVATRDAADRLRHLGEPQWRIHLAGAPGLDLLADEASGDEMAVRAEVGLARDEPYLLVVQHPETVGESAPAEDMTATLRAVDRSGLAALAIGPNADAGGRAMAAELANAQGRLRVEASLPRRAYATLLAHAAALVGNSSSGIIEAPFLGVPAVNIGDRQAGRTRGDNVIDVPASEDAILAGIERAIDASFRASLSKTSPYGDGRAASRIVGILLEQPLDQRLLVKADDGSVE